MRRKIVIGLTALIAAAGVGAAPGASAAGNPASAAVTARPCEVHSETLRVGSRGQAVRDAQCLLTRAGNKLGFGSTKIDGKFEQETLRNTIAFQKAVGLRPDGEIGPKTWGALSRYAPGAAD